MLARTSECPDLLRLCRTNCLHLKTTHNHSKCLHQVEGASILLLKSLERVYMKRLPNFKPVGGGFGFLMSAKNGRRNSTLSYSKKPSLYYPFRHSVVLSANTRIGRLILNGLMTRFYGSILCSKSEQYPPK